MHDTTALQQCLTIEQEYIYSSPCFKNRHSTYVSRVHRIFVSKLNMSTRGEPQYLIKDYKANSVAHVSVSTTRVYLAANQRESIGDNEATPYTCACTARPTGLRWIVGEPNSFYRTFSPIRPPASHQPAHPLAALLPRRSPPAAHLLDHSPATELQTHTVSISTQPVTPPVTMAVLRRLPSLLALLALLVVARGADPTVSPSPNPSTSVTPSPKAAPAETAAKVTPEAAKSAVPSPAKPAKDPLPGSAFDPKTQAKRRGGISAGVVVFLLLLAAAAGAGVYFWRKRQRAAAPVPPAGGPEGDYQF